MGHPQKEPLRRLSAAERDELERIARAGSGRADRVARAKALLAVADGARFRPSDSNGEISVANG